MRKSVISSSVTTVVAHAIDSLVAAGMAVRAFLHHPNMRERLGNGQRPCAAGPERLHQRSRCCNTAGFGTDGMGTGTYSSGNAWRVVWQLCQGVCLKRPVQHAFALSPAYAAIARYAHRG
jgi:hypothetical protein